MNYYNVVLLPSQEFAQELTEFCQQNLKDVADGYCLSEKVLPHITLCQFQCSEMLDLSSAKAGLNNMPNVLGYDIRASGMRAGYFWAALLIEKEDWLVRLQKEVRDELIGKAVEVRTVDSQNYLPHLTFCQVAAGDREKLEEISVPESFLQRHEGWEIKIGNSDVNGQFLG